MEKEGAIHTYLVLAIATWNLASHALLSWFVVDHKVGTS